MNNKDRAGKKYWDDMWEHSCIPKIMMSEGPSRVIDEAINKFMHRYMDNMLIEDKDIKFLEVGCGNSTFLPYIAKEFGIKVFGIDYSTTGCETAKRNLVYYGEDGKIVCADMFDPPKEMMEAFDIVYSGGVIEHFEDTEKCCKALSYFLRPGGLCITEIPNTSPEGIIMKLQKKIDKSIYDIHVPLDSN